MKAIKSTGFLYCLLSLTILSAGARPAAARPFWQKLLRIAGISATPSQMKGPDDNPANGEIWIVDIKKQQRRKLSQDAGFSSPVFVPDGKSVLALRSNDICRIPLSGGAPAKLQAIPGISKLVGFSRDDTNLLCLLVEQRDELLVEFLSCDTGAISVVAYDRDAPEDQRMIDQIKGWEREYEETKLYLDKQNKAGLSGEIEWTDVFLKKRGESPLNLSQGNGINCGQPSLSPSGNEVVFIKAAP